MTPIPATQEGGSPLSFASKSHIDSAWSYWYDPHLDPPEDDDPMETRYTWRDHAPMALGDVTFHHGWCLHGAPPNKLKDARIALTLAYVSDDAKTLAKDAPYMPDPEDDISYEKWLKEVRPGNFLHHPLVPIVYDQAQDR